MKIHFIRGIPVFLAGLALAGEPEQITAVMDGSGGASDNTVAIGGANARNIGAGMQPGGVAVSTGGGLVNQAGFLQAATIKYPGRDADGDGIPDELDADNDGDTLADRAEVDGTAFGGYAATDPNRADTDGDGMADDREAAGMYDPLDPNHRLEIVSLTHAGDDFTVRWIGKGGGTMNAVVACDAIANDSFVDDLVRQPYAGGVAPWYKATNTHTWTGAGLKQFLRAETGP